MSIKVIKGTEYTESVWPVAFPTTITPFTNDRMEVANGVKQNVDGQEKLTLKTDESLLEKGRRAESIA